MAIRTDPTRVVLSFGVRTSSYAERPATDAVPDVVTAVSLPITARAAAAASSGVRGTPDGSGPGTPGEGEFSGRLLVAPARAWSASSLWCTADLSALDHSQTSAPLWMTSDSPLPPMRASRWRVGPSSQIRHVCVPDTSEVIEVLAEPGRPEPARPGISGRPRSEVCTTVPDRLETFAVRTSASSWAAVRDGSPLSALAVWLTVRATAPMTPTAATGSAQRVRGWSRKMLMGPSCVPAAESPLRPRIRDEPHVVSPPWHRGSVRVLLVEDEARMAAAVVRGLTAEGFVVDHVADGQAGLEAARFGAYDVVVLDIMLPGMSGYSVVRTLREEENWVPVLLLSAKDGEHDVADGLDYGADGYLTKPFSFVVLLARLRVLLRREAGPRPTALAVGPISLDPAAHRVTLDGSEVSVSRREFLVLEHLLRAHPAVVSKES